MREIRKNYTILYSLFNNYLFFEAFYLQRLPEVRFDFGMGLLKIEIGRYGPSLNGCEDFSNGNQAGSWLTMADV